MSTDSNKIIQSAAKAVLQKEGLFQKGASRIWIDDNGWYLTIIEFQPSGYAKGAYLNVATHYLWKETDHFTFDYGGRIGDFKAFSGDTERFLAEMTELAQTAIRQVREYRRFCDLKYAKKRILNAKAANEIRELYNKLMICGLCKDAAAQKYFRLLQKKRKSILYPWEQQIYEELERQIASVIDNPQAMYSYIVEKIMRQRDFWRCKSGMNQMHEQISL